MSHQSMGVIPSEWIEIEKMNTLIGHSCEAPDAFRRKDAFPFLSWFFSSSTSSPSSQSWCTFLSPPSCLRYLLEANGLLELPATPTLPELVRDSKSELKSKNTSESKVHPLCLGVTYKWSPLRSSRRAGFSTNPLPHPINHKGGLSYLLAKSTKDGQSKLPGTLTQERVHNGRRLTI